MLPTLRRLAIVLSALAFSPAALAWSALGHRLVGELAERHLSPSAESQVKALLAGESDPTLAGVAVWADDLRNDDPARFKLTQKWHYIDTPPGTCHYEPARDCPNGDCAIGAIERQRAILADRQQPLAARRDALKFVVHFVGDIHQPMHANNRDDKGGNDFQISLRTDMEPEAWARNRYANGVMGTSLHSVWDYYILGSEGLDLRHYANRLDALPWPPMVAATSGSEAWAGESCRLVDARHLYPEKHAMDRTYLDKERPLAEQRVRQAAYRLAQLLDATLGH
jgi:nuclease S1